MGEPLSKRFGKGKLNEKWKTLVAGHEYVIDVGVSWQDRVYKTVFPENETHVYSSLPWGSTDRPGYELEVRPTTKRMILRIKGRDENGGRDKNRNRGRRKKLIAHTSETLSYEPVPVETVLWDGQGTSGTSDAFQMLKEKNATQDRLRQRFGRRKPRRATKKKPPRKP